MSRSPRLHASGVLQHVMSRGVNRMKIFHTDADRDDLLGRLAFLAGGDKIQVYAFSLMPNHFHLLVRPLLMPLPTFMSRLLTSYSMRFNQRYNRTGHVFQDRYKSFLVEKESYLFQLIRYIHLNPIRSGSVKSLAKLASWPYTGHPTLLGLNSRPWIETDEVLSHFASNKNSARRNLLEFMEDDSYYDLPLPGSMVHNDQLDKLLKTVAAHYGLSVPELRSGSKRPIVSKARHTTILLGVKCLELPVNELARLMSIKPLAVYRAISDKRREFDNETAKIIQAISLSPAQR